MIYDLRFTIWLKRAALALLLLATFNLQLSTAFMETTSKNLREATALLAHCHAFVSVDTALMHLAAAMKVPHQIVIETATFNKTIEPHQRPYVLVRNPMVNGRNLDYYRYDGRDIQGTPEHLIACMRSIKVRDVLAPVQQAMSSGTEPREP